VVASFPFIDGLLTQITIERYNQKLIEELAAAEPDPNFDAKLAWLREHVPVPLNAPHKLHGVDVILASGETQLCGIASAAGYACGALPLGYGDTNGRAFGMHAVASHDKIDVMMRVMSAWEATFPEGRKPPPLLVNWPEDQ
jgi:amidase